MTGGLAGVVLAAGAGTRLRPLTRYRPKALCPVDGTPLLDLAVARAASAVGPTAVAVNAHHEWAAVAEHLAAGDGPAVHLSVEEPEALGTAGALGRLRTWIHGRAVLVTNADAWLPATSLDLAGFVAGWDGERVRLLCVRDPARGDFGDLRYCGVALHPWSALAAMAAEPSGLYEVCWRHEAAAGRLDLAVHDGPFVDCGTVADYLAANLAASGGRPVVDPGAVVGAGAEVERSVLWAGAVVAPGERLVDAVRTPDVTVLVR